MMMKRVRQQDIVCAHRARYLVGQSIRHVELLSRSGHFGSGGKNPSLAGLLSGAGWASAVTCTRCDAACAEEMTAVLAARGQGAT